MRYENESQLNLRFMKTFALAAERVSLAGKSTDMSVEQYAEYLKTLSKEYPALENVVWELNLHYGSNMRVPNVSDEDDYGRSQHFTALSHALAVEMKQRFSGIRPWYDGNTATLPQQLDAAFVNMNSSSEHIKNKYWLYHTLGLSLQEIQAKKSEFQQQMFDEIEQRNLSEQVAVVMESFGLVVDEQDGDDINNILCDVGNEFLLAKGKVNAGEVAVSLRDRLHESWDFSDSNDKLLLSLMTPVESLKQVIHSVQKKMKSWNYPEYYLNKMQGVLGDVADSEQLQDEIYSLGNMREKKTEKRWKDGKPLPDYLENLENDEAFQKVNSESAFWCKYETAGAALHSPEWQERLGLVLGGWSQMLWNETSEIDRGLDEFWSDKQNSADDSDDDDDEKEEMFGGNEEKVQLFKEEALAFAGKFVVLAEAAENYLGIVLNDSGISQKTLDKISREEGLSDEASRVIELVVDTFDKNYNIQDFFPRETVLDADENSDVFIDKLAKLPHSPAKRDVANLMLQNFQLQKRDLESEDEIVTENLVEKIETVHQNQYETLSDFVSYAVNTYPELSGEKANVYADDFSYLVSANLVVPLYLDVQPYPGAKEKILEELNGYENYSPEARKFMSGLIDSYFKAIKPIHEDNKKRIDDILLTEDEKLLEEDSLASAITEYKDMILRSDELQQQIGRLEEISRGEEAVYRKYEAFQERREMYHISDKAMRRALMQAKIFVR